MAEWLRRTSATEGELCQFLIDGSYEHHDLLLGQLLTQVDDNTHIIVVSAGGFSPAAFGSGNEGSCSIAKPMSRSSGLAVICGPEIRQNIVLGTGSILDLVPTILTLFGLPFGKDMSGGPRTELFESPIPAETTETWESLASESAIVERETETTSEGDLSDQMSHQRVKHLLALEYLDPLDMTAREAVLHCERTAVLNRAISLLDTGLISEATTVLEQLTREHPNWYSTRSLLAETYYRGTRLKDARKVIDDLRCQGYEYPQLYLLATAVEIDNRQFDLAMQELHCARRGSILPFGWSVLEGNIHLRRGELEAAEAAFQKSVAAEGSTVDVLDGLAAVKLRTGDFESAALFALDALAMDMRHARSHYHLAVALYFLEKPHEALQALSSWSAVEPTAAAPYRWMARIHERQLDNPIEAESHRKRGTAIIRRRRQLMRHSQAEGTSAPSSAE